MMIEEDFYLEEKESLVSEIEDLKRELETMVSSREDRISQLEEENEELRYHLRNYASIVFRIFDELTLPQIEGAVGERKYSGSTNRFGISAMTFRKLAVAVKASHPKTFLQYKIYRGFAVESEKTRAESGMKKTRRKPITRKEVAK